MKQETPELLIDMQGGFRLRNEYRYTFENGDYVVVPEGYKTNFASIPSIARMFLSPIDSDLVIASIVHDWVIQEFNTLGKYPYIYRDEPAFINRKHEMKTSAIIVDKVIDRLQAAAIMRNVMRETGCPTWKRQLVYGALRSYEALRNMWAE